MGNDAAAAAGAASASTSRAQRREQLSDDEEKLEEFDDVPDLGDSDGDSADAMLQAISQFTSANPSSKKGKMIGLNPDDFSADNMLPMLLDENVSVDGLFAPLGGDILFSLMLRWYRKRVLDRLP